MRAFPTNLSKMLLQPLSRLAACSGIVQTDRSARLWARGAASLVAAVSLLAVVPTAMAQMSGGAAAQNPAVQGILQGILQGQWSGGFGEKVAGGDAQGRPLDTQTVERLYGRSTKKECRFAAVDGQGRPLLPEMRSGDGRPLGGAELQSLLT